MKWNARNKLLEKYDTVEVAYGVYKGYAVKVREKEGQYHYLAFKESKASVYYSSVEDGKIYLSEDEAKAAALAYVDNVTSWGGARPGSGRPPISKPRRPRSIRLTDEEYDRVKAFIQQMRECGDQS